MTTHELARKLLEGPDVSVVFDGQACYGEAPDPDEVSDVSPIVLWRYDYAVGGGKSLWGDWHYDRPMNETLTVQSKPAVRLR